jgi:outer membrane protein assembly factor BamB
MTHGVRYTAWRKPFGFGVLAALGFMAVGPAMPSARAQVPIQFGAKAARAGQPGEDQTLDGPFQPPSHETTRHLDQAKKLIEEGHYSDGLQILDDIMQSDEDFFLRPEPGQSSHRGLKDEVQRLISQQSPEGLAAYELQFGAKAQKMLNDALAANDIEAVGQVARRYFNTKAGNEATLLVGVWDLDHNQPLAGALCLQRLHDVASAASYEPSLSVMLSFCWYRGGQESRAKEILLELKKKDSGATIHIGGKSIKLFTDDKQALPWLTDNLGKDHASFGAELAQWAIFRGNPARNAASAGGVPLLDRRWGVWTTENPSAVITSRQANIDRNIPIMPVSQPLAVADVVLMRTTNGLLAVDFVTGKRIWAADNTKEETQHGGPRNVMQQQAEASLGERLWENATLGTLASDGQYVFMVEDPKSDGFSTDQQRVVVRQFGVWRGPIDQATNQLAAYELSSQGKVKWKVGGSDKRDFDIEPKLAGVYFLGAPLPLDGLLYVLAERPKDQAVYLVVLDAKTGKLQWQQQLVATTDSNMNGFQENYRRLTGATPSFADGVLVCPTSAGAIVAVDVATHKLLWGYEYPQGQVGQGPNMMAMRFAMGNGGFPVPSYAGDRWADATATIVDGRVLVTPVEVGGEQPMYCLSLIDGKLLWKVEQRGDNVYIGAAYDGKVLVVGKRKVEALNLADGKPLWSLDLDAPAEGTVTNAAKPEPPKPEAVNPDGTRSNAVAGGESGSAAATPRGAMPAGRGFLSGGCYYLPLSTAEVARIDIARGTIVSRARSRKGLIPGNLICYKDDVISLGVDSLDAFHQIEPLKARVAEALAKNPNDPEALADRGRIELDEGKLSDSIQNIRRAYDQETREVAAVNQEFSSGRITEEEAQKRRKRPESGLAVTRGLLVDAMLAALRSDFKGSRVSIGDLEKLIALDSERAEFLRMLADGLQKSGDRLAAVDAYLKLADLQWGQGEPESVEPNLSVRRDRWVEARMEAIYTSANPADRSKIDAELSERLKTVLAGKNDKELRAYANYFSFHPTADDARAALFRQLTGNESMIERQSLLSELELSGDPVQRRAATAQMAALLRSASRPEEAAIYYSRLKTDFADQVCLDGKTGKQIVAELPANSPETRALAESTNWPSGAVKVNSNRNAGGMNFQHPMPIAWQGDRGPFFESTTILYDPQQQIVGRDGLGRERFRIPLSEAGQNRFGYQPINATTAFASAKGNLLFVNLGTQLLALDTLRPINAGSRVLWQQELFELAPNVFNAGVQMRQIHFPWGQDKQIQQYGEAAVLGVVGPITDRCVCIARARDLLALDPLTGATLWTWHGLPQGAEVFGDNDAVIIAPPDGSNAVVLRTTDGQRLGRCNVPSADHRAGYHGRRVLTWRSADASNGKLEILLADPWKGQDEVLGEFTAVGLKGTTVNDEALAIYEPNGRFRVLSLADGRKLIDERLEPEASLGDIVVEATPDQFLLVARHGTPHSQLNNQQYMPMNMQGFDASVQLVSGNVYAFSRATGKRLWSVPALVEHEYMVVDQGQQLPVVLFMRPPRRDAPQVGGEGQGRILCLDRRNGRALLDEDVPLQINNYHFSITGDRQTNTISLNASNHTFTLQFTDDPVPPEPPYQARLALLKAPVMGTASKAVLGALGHTLGESGNDSGDDDQNDGR